VERGAVLQVVNEVGKVCLTDARPRRILYADLDAPKH